MFRHFSGKVDQIGLTKMVKTSKICKALGNQKYFQSRRKFIKTNILKVRVNREKPENEMLGLFHDLKSWKSVGK